MKLTGYIAAAVISACPFFYGQSAGFSIGYSMLKMTDVNRSLEYMRNAVTGPGIYIEPGEIKKGLFLEAGIRYGIGNANAGVLVDYISSSGGYGFSDQDGLFRENLDVSTTELLLSLEYLLGNDNYKMRPFVRAAGGIGFASAHYSLDLRIYQDPSYNVDADQPLARNYIAARFEGGLQIFIQPFTLEFAAGYRVADPGGLKGDQTVNGYTTYNVNLRDLYGGPVEFDYSGFLMRGGIYLRLQ